MKIWLPIHSLATAVLLWLLSSFAIDSHYWFMWPPILLAAAALLAGLIGLTKRRLRRRAFWAGTACVLALPLTAKFAFSLWPGGDDGPGMAWGLGVLPFTWTYACAAGLAGAVAYAHHRFRAGEEAVQRGGLRS